MRRLQLSTVAALHISFSFLFSFVPPSPAPLVPDVAAAAEPHRAISCAQNVSTAACRLCEHCASLSSGCEAKTAARLEVYGPPGVVEEFCRRSRCELGADEGRAEVADYVCEDFGGE